MNAAAQPLAISTDEAKLLFAKSVDALLAFMAEHRLQHAPLKIVSEGHGDIAAFEVGAHCDLLVARGCEIVSHSTSLLRVPKGDVTVTSILVRAPVKSD